MSGLLQTIMFFGYSALLSGALATICGMKCIKCEGERSCCYIGTVSFFACSAFLRRLYGGIKNE